MNYEAFEHSRTNREKKMQPNRCKYWCIGCDRALVSPGVKCHVCGYYNGIKKLKKETNA
jgi:hypothetical protein